MNTTIYLDFELVFDAKRVQDKSVIWVLAAEF